MVCLAQLKDLFIGAVNGLINRLRYVNKDGFSHGIQ